MSRARILIVEDEGVIAEHLRLMVEQLGYQVVAIAASGPDALEQAAELRPDLVLMDIVLRASSDGVGVAADLRDRLHLPVIYLTGHTDNATLQRAKVTGPYGYLIKPVVEDELRIALELALHKHAAESRLVEQNLRLATTLASFGNSDSPADVAATPIRDELGAVAGVILMFRDPIPRRRPVEERHQHADDFGLSTVRERPHALPDWLPVCSSCKRVRDDMGGWDAVDDFVVKRGLAKVTHGICPACIRALYPGLAGKILDCTGGVNPAAEHPPSPPA